jgi:hypothetical protein
MRKPVSGIENKVRRQLYFVEVGSLTLMHACELCRMS